jgi:hypothetical protein
VGISRHVYAEHCDQCPSNSLLIASPRIVFVREQVRRSDEPAGESSREMLVERESRGSSPDYCPSSAKPARRGRYQMLTLCGDEYHVGVPSPEEVPQSPCDSKPRSIPREWNDIESGDITLRDRICSADPFGDRGDLGC